MVLVDFDARLALDLARSVANLSLGLLLFLLTKFYLSRFKKDKSLSVWLIACLAAFAAVYYVFLGILVFVLVFGGVL